MKSPIRLSGLLVAVAAVAIAAAVPALAAGDDPASGGAVFVQTNALEGNAIAAYHRHGDGSLTPAGIFPTGGLGGRAAGAGSDPLASQGSLVLLSDADLLVAVNAGSDTVSVFGVDGAQLELRQVLSSGGPFPTGFAVHDDLVYVLDAGGQGYVSGFRVAGGRLHPIEGSTRSLGLANATTPFFLGAPAEAGFTPDGGHLLVTTKTNNTLEAFAIGADGRPSAAPVVDAAPGVPFAFDFDAAGRLVLNFAATSSLQTYTVNADGTITAVSSAVSDGRAALCWVTGAAGYRYASNTGTGDVSQFRVDGSGAVSLVSSIAASGIPGATDSGAAGGRFLYVQSGATGAVHAFGIGAGGSLTPLQVIAIPDGDDQEGIAVR